MSRIYFDSMLFIYWIESHPIYGAKVDSLYERFRRRNDEICTGILTIGEVLVLPIRERNLAIQQQIEAFFDSGVVHLLPVDRNVVHRFAQIRAAGRTAPVDALHLACAGSYGCDLFLTHDIKLHKLQVPGIQFIAGLDVSTI